MRSRLIVAAFLLLCSGLIGCNAGECTVVQPVIQYESTITHVEEGYSTSSLRLKDTVLRTDDYLFYLDDREEWSEDGLQYLRHIPILTRIQKTTGTMQTVEMPAMSRSEWFMLPQENKLVLWGADGQSAIVQFLNYALEVECTVTMPTTEDIVEACVTDTNLFLVTLSNVYQLSLDGKVISNFSIAAKGITGAEAYGETVILGYMQHDDTFILQVLDFSGVPRVAEEHIEMAPTSISLQNDAQWQMLCMNNEREFIVYQMSADGFEFEKHNAYSRIVTREKWTYVPKLLADGRLLLVTKNDSNSMVLQFTLYNEEEILSSFQIQFEKDGELEQLAVVGNQLRFIYKIETTQTATLSEYLCDMPIA